MGKNRIKRAITGFVFAWFFVMIQAATINAEEIVAGGYCGAIGNEENVRWSLDDEGKLIISGTGDMADYSLEQNKQSPWYDERKSVDKIEIEGITKVGDYAFYDCNEKELVFKDNNLIEIGSYAFCRNRYLPTFELPRSLKIIGDYSFANNTEKLMIDKLILPELTKIGEGAFSANPFIHNIYVPGTLEEISAGAFGGCAEVGEIEIAEGVKRIMSGAIGGAKKVLLPNSLEYLADDCGITSGKAVYGKNDYTKKWAKNHDLIYVDLASKKDVSDIKFYSFPSTVEYFYTGQEIVIDSMAYYEFSDDDIGIVILDLVEGTDYSLEFSNNINPGVATIKVTGLGMFEGSETELQFPIYEFIGNCDITLDNQRYLYTGSEIKPDCIVKHNDSVLKENEDYTVEYENNVEAGQAKVIIKGLGSYVGGDEERTFEIYKHDIAQADVSLEYSEVLYDGKKKEPTVVVKHDGNTLKENQDYFLSYSSNTDAGMATVTIEGKGCYEGVTTKTFNIFKHDLLKADIELEYLEVLYDGKKKEPTVVVKHDGNALKENQDYFLSYSSNTDAGMATVTIEGKGCYDGTVTKTFKIYKYDITKSEVTLSYNEILYDGTEKIPDITVKYDGRELIKDKDYRINVSDNIKPCIVTLKIEGLYQYIGTVEKQFEIKGLSIENAEIKLKESIYSYDGSPKTPSVEVKLGDKILVQDSDYTLSYENNINDGTAHAVVTGIGIYTDVVKTSFIILPYNAGMDSVYPEGTMIDGDFAYGVTDDEKNEVELFCPASQNVKNIQIPATITDENGTVYTVTSIGNKAFYKNTKITGVTIANTVKSIEDYAFYGCKNIKTIKMGSGVELIGNSAFRKCTKLTSVILPKSLDQLGKNVFYGCSKLKTITINAKSVVDIKANAIKGISKKAVIKVPSKLVKKYKKEFDKKSGFKGGMKVKKN